jgi:hypothetical protein
MTHRPYKVVPTAPAGTGPDIARPLVAPRRTSTRCGRLPTHLTIDIPPGHGRARALRSYKRRQAGRDSLTDRMVAHTARSAPMDGSPCASSFATAESGRARGGADRPFPPGMHTAQRHASSRRVLWVLWSVCVCVCVCACVRVRACVGRRLPGAQLVAAASPAGDRTKRLKSPTRHRPVTAHSYCRTHSARYLIVLLLA